eukprot:2582460-Pleurochrysis_carterae.AAC.1
MYLHALRYRLDTTPVICGMQQRKQATVCELNKLLTLCQASGVQSVRSHRERETIQHVLLRVYEGTSAAENSGSEELNTCRKMNYRAEGNNAADLCKQLLYYRPGTWELREAEDEAKIAQIKVAVRENISKVTGCLIISLRTMKLMDVQGQMKGGTLSTTA